MLYSLFQGYAISYDINHNRNMLRLVRFDGALLPRMYLYWQPPNMLPVQQLWTSEAYKAYEQGQGRNSAAAATSGSNSLLMVLASVVAGLSLVARL